MALCIEIHRHQVAELMRANPDIPEAQLDELIVRHANDRRYCRFDIDTGIYVNNNNSGTLLDQFKKIVRHEMSSGVV